MQFAKLMMENLEHTKATPVNTVSRATYNTTHKFTRTLKLQQEVLHVLLTVTHKLPTHLDVLTDDLRHLAVREVSDGLGRGFPSSFYRYIIVLLKVNASAHASK